MNGKNNVCRVVLLFLSIDLLTARHTVAAAVVVVVDPAFLNISLLHY